MNTQPIREYNPNALIDIAKHLDFSTEFSKEPVYKTITFSDYEELFIVYSNILDAITTIGIGGEGTNDLFIAGALASLMKKMLPYKELCFLDSLLIKDKDNKTDFQPIANL